MTHFSFIPRMGNFKTQGQWAHERAIKEKHGLDLKRDPETIDEENLDDLRATGDLPKGQ